MTDVIVIGGGLNGLVAAAMLAKRMASVVVIDRQPGVGGAAATSEFSPGFLAPTLSHSLGPVSRAVVREFRLDRAGVEFITPDPTLTSLADDGRALTFHRDAVLTAASINQFSAGDAGRWSEFKRAGLRLAGFLARLNDQAPPPIDGPMTGEIWRLIGLGRAARKLGPQDLATLSRWMPMSIADVTAEWFESDILRAAVAAHAISGHPVGPRSAGTGGMYLTRLAADPMPVGSGVTARGGPGAVTTALAKIAADRGASIRTGERVTQIVTQDGRATGVVLANGDVLSARVVVAAVSPKLVLGELTPPAELPASYRERILHIRSRGVTAKINLALSGAPAFTALGSDAVPLRGRLLMAPSLDYLERAFDATKYGEMSPDPWLEAAMPSVLDRALAPAGGHVMSIYAHCAPHTLRRGSWDAVRSTLNESVLRILERHAPGIRGQIVAMSTLTPTDLETHWGMPGGHIFHGEHTLDQLWVARPLLGYANYRTPLRGLYLASAGTHPGGALTGQNGLLAAQAVADDLKRRVI